MPRELRDKIYADCFATKNGNNLVTPDSDRSRRQTPGCDTSCTVNGPIALLQTCRQVHDEGIDFLYKGRTFLFTSHQHADRVELTWEPVDGDRLELAMLHYNDLWTFTDFLNSIGSSNRKKIEHPTLYFPENLQYRAILVTDERINDFQLPKNRLASGLRLLSAGHCLKVLEVCVGVREGSLAVCGSR